MLHLVHFMLTHVKENGSVIMMIFLQINQNTFMTSHGSWLTLSLETKQRLSWVEEEVHFYP